MAPPPPAPRQGPRQLLSSLLGLADLCPEEWPHRGASQVAARQRDAAAAAEGRDSTSAGALHTPTPASGRLETMHGWRGNPRAFHACGWSDSFIHVFGWLQIRTLLIHGSAQQSMVPPCPTGPAAFERPSLILLRQSVADAIEVHWDSLERLVDFGLSCSTRFARLALVRMLVRMAGLGAGLAPLLGPKVCSCVALCVQRCALQGAGRPPGNFLGRLGSSTPAGVDTDRLPPCTPGALFGRHSFHAQPPPTADVACCGAGPHKSTSYKKVHAAVCPACRCCWPCAAASMASSSCARGWRAGCCRLCRGQCLQPSAASSS